MENSQTPPEKKENPKNTNAKSKDNEYTHLLSKEREKIYPTEDPDAAASKPLHDTKDNEAEAERKRKERESAASSIIIIASLMLSFLFSVMTSSGIFVAAGLQHESDANGDAWVWILLAGIVALISSVWNMAIFIGLIQIFACCCMKPPVKKPEQQV